MRFELFLKHDIRYFHFKYLLDAFSDVEGKILDVGCGMGGISAYLKTLRDELTVIACDSNLQYLRECKRKFGRSKVDWVLSDAQKLRFGKDEFDAVLMVDVLEHLKKPDKAISEVARVLKNGGAFYLVVPLEASLITIDGWVKKIFGKNLKKIPIGHLQQFREKEIREMLARHGFKVKEIRFTYHFFYQLASFFYYFYLAKARKGEYLALTSDKPILGRFLSGLVKIGGFCVYLENRLLARFKGQTAHISATLIADGA